MKQKQMLYCINGYHTLKSIENQHLLGLIQTRVDFGAKYGRFDIDDAVVGRKTVSREVATSANAVSYSLAESLNNPITDGTLALCIDMYTDDYSKQSYAVTG